jgi:hypothetical protein
MMPITAAQLVSFADVQYRQNELAQEFARVRRGRRRRQERRAARHARAAATPTLPTSPAWAPAASAPTPRRADRPSTTGIPTQASTDRSPAVTGASGRRPAA